MLLLFTATVMDIGRLNNTNSKHNKVKSKMELSRELHCSQRHARCPQPSTLPAPAIIVLSKISENWR